MATHSSPVFVAVLLIVLDLHNCLICARFGIICHAVLYPSEGYCSAAASRYRFPGCWLPKRTIVHALASARNSHQRLQTQADPAAPCGDSFTVNFLWRGVTSPLIMSLRPKNRRPTLIQTHLSVKLEYRVVDRPTKLRESETGIRRRHPREPS